MRLSLQLSLAALTVSLLTQLGGCGCGFDCNSNSDNGNPAIFTLGLSDSLPEELQEVVIEVDSITFKRSNGSEVKVDSFTIGNETDLSTFQVNLLDYRGLRNLVVIEDMELPAGSYDAVNIQLVIGSNNNSYVVTETGTQLPITVSNGGVLQLPGMQLASGTEQFVVEFGLAQALLYQASPNNYLLSNTGIRVEDTATAASLSGQVDTALFDSVTPCSEKQDPLSGNRIYIYQKSSSATAKLADVFTSASTETIPANARAPFAVASLVQSGTTGTWEYSFGYLPAGDYTMAFACNTAADNSVTYDGLTIPLPTDQQYEVSLDEGERAVCNLAEGAGC